MCIVPEALDPIVSGTAHEESEPTNQVHPFAAETEIEAAPPSAGIEITEGVTKY